MWLFSNPKDYNEMIEKISKSVFFITLFLVFMFSSSNKDFSDFLKSISFGVEYDFNGIKISIALFYIPFIIAILENIFKFHDKISDFFGIRKNFDRKIIVNEFLILLSLDKKVQDMDENTIKTIMSNAFYEYASSTLPKIDSHCIFLSLGSWCWFWIFMDTLVVSIVIGILFLIKNPTCLHVRTFIIVILVISIFMFNIWNQSKKYAKYEVKAILYKYKEKVEKSIKDALQN